MRWSCGANCVPPSAVTIAIGSLAAMREPVRSDGVIQRGRRWPLSWTLERHLPGVFSHWFNPMDLQRLQRRSAKSAKSALNRSAPVSAEFVNG
jgi:hypothetical protein